MRITHRVFDSQEVSERTKRGENVFGHFLTESGLYDTIEVTEENIQDLIDLVRGEVKLNIYCRDCGEKRIFYMNGLTYPYEDDRSEQIRIRELADEMQQLQKLPKIIPAPNSLPEKHEWRWTNWQIDSYTRLMCFQFECALNKEHHVDYIVRADGNTLTKIGQYPSVADLSFPELDVYKKVISSEDRKELGRALGLYASGIGIGSFVYLRRIFERILNKAKSFAIKDGNLSEDEYRTAHVDERIEMLKGYLPEAMAGNTAFYGIVSKGIHELSEEECIRYFPVLKECIIMILRQWEKTRQDEEAQKNIANSLSKIAGEIK